MIWIEVAALVPRHRDKYRILSGALLPHAHFTTYGANRA